MMNNPVDVMAIEEAAQRDLERRQQIEDEQTEELKRLLEMREARNFVWRLLERAGVFTSSYTGDNDTFFREGQRNIGLFVLDAVMSAAPERFTQMMKEHEDVGTSDS